MTGSGNGHWDRVTSRIGRMRPYADRNSAHGEHRVPGKVPGGIGPIYLRTGNSAPPAPSWEAVAATPLQRTGTGGPSAPHEHRIRADRAHATNALMSEPLSTA